MRALVPVIFMLLVSGPALAQPEPPPIVDPADIFAPGIEVVETLPVVTYDNDARLLWFFDPKVMIWESFAYPDEWETSDVAFGRSENQAVMIRINRRDWSDFSNMIVLDIDTGEFDSHEYVCDGVPRGTGPEWVIYQLKDRSFLCNTITGKTSDPLVAEVGSKAKRISRTANTLFGGVDGGQPELSPDGEWILFDTWPVETGDPLKPYSDPVFIFAYELATGTTILLGQIGEANPSPAWFHEVDFWQDNVTPIIRDGGGVSASNSYYRATITQANSIEKLFEQDVMPSVLYESPARYILTRHDFDDSLGVTSGSLIVYEYVLETDEQRELLEVPCVKAEEYQLRTQPSLCSPSVAILNETQTFVAILSQDAVPYRLPDRARNSVGHGALISIFDLETGNLVYQSTFTSRNRHWGNVSDFMWLNNSAFMHSYAINNRSLITTQVVHFNLSDGGFIVSILDQSNFRLIPPYRRSPDDELILANDVDEIPLVYDGETLRVIPIFKETIFENTLATVRWDTSNTLKVMIFDADEEHSHSLERNILGNWIIRIQ